jgi:prepilin-type N-terminal cleavage/methylation domain-containing protein
MFYEFLPERRSRFLSGFTLTEMLAAIACFGILVSIASPSFLAFRQDQELSQAQSKVHHILRQGRDRAMKTNLSTQVSFRPQGDKLQWAIHPMGTEPMQWETLGYRVGIDGETTLRSKQGSYVIQFNHYGEVNGQLGRLTLSMKNTGRKRCVIVSSLLGAMRDGETHGGKKSGNKTCF